MAKLFNNLSNMKKTRARFVLVTFMGEYGKPERIVGYEKGDVIRLGPLVCYWDYPEFVNYWKRILHWHGPRL